jgi:hypothetical protein
MSDENYKEDNKKNDTNINKKKYFFSLYADTQNHLYIGTDKPNKISKILDFNKEYKFEKEDRESHKIHGEFTLKLDGMSVPKFFRLYSDNFSVISFTQSSFPSPNWGYWMIYICRTENNNK